MTGNQLVNTFVLQFTSDDEFQIRQAEISKQEEEHDKQRIQKAYENSGAPRRYWHESFDTYIPRNEDESRILENIKAYALRPNNNKVLLMIGTKGLGKTHLGCAIVRKCGGSYVIVEDIILKYEAAQDFKNEITREILLNRYSTVKMLIIDEIGRSIQPDKENALLSYILRRRYENMLPTVLISNLGKNELLKKLGEAVFDRFRETAITVEFKGESYRLKKRDSGL